MNGYMKRNIKKYNDFYHIIFLFLKTLFIYKKLRNPIIITTVMERNPNPTALNETVF